MTLVLKIVDKTGIFKKVDQKAETLCYVMIVASVALSLAPII